jgi:hypothetical protein
MRCANVVCNTGAERIYRRGEENKMTDITTIATDVLEKDLQESRNDISVCGVALSKGVMIYSGGSVASRLQANEHFVDVITKELKRRAEIKESTAHLTTAVA